MKHNIMSFFAGVGGIDLGFKQANSDFETVYANEFDKNALKTLSTNWTNADIDSRDIVEVSEDLNSLLQYKSDVVLAGLPCQSYSVAGYRKGLFDARGQLFFNLLEIIKEKSPSVVMIENVKNLAMHDNGNSFRVIREFLVKAGYYLKWNVLNGKDYGNVPQNRERIYIVGFKDKSQFDAFKWPEAIDLTTSLADIIDFDVDAGDVSKFNDAMDDKYFYNAVKNKTMFPTLLQEITRNDRIYQWRRQYVRENKSGVVPTLTANMGTGGHNVPLILTNLGAIRKLTPRETFNAQGYPVDFKFPDKLANGPLYKQAGNSVVVPVIKRIAEKIDLAMGQHYSRKPLPNWYNMATLMVTKMQGRISGEAYPIFNAIDEVILDKTLQSKIANGDWDDLVVYDSSNVKEQAEQFKKLKASQDLSFYTKLI